MRTTLTMVESAISVKSRPKRRRKTVQSQSSDEATADQLASAVLSLSSDQLQSMRLRICRAGLAALDEKFGAAQS